MASTSTSYTSLSLLRSEAEAGSTLPHQAALSYITSIPEEQAVLVVAARPIIVVGQWLFVYVAHSTGKYSGQSEPKKGLRLATNRHKSNRNEIPYYWH
jgi:hypothetical protein